MCMVTGCVYSTVTLQAIENCIAFVKTYNHSCKCIIHTDVSNALSLSLLTIPLSCHHPVSLAPLAFNLPSLFLFLLSLLAHSLTIYRLSLSPPPPLSVYFCHLYPYLLSLFLYLSTLLTNPLSFHGTLYNHFSYRSISVNSLSLPNTLTYLSSPSSICLLTPFRTSATNSNQ